jgi:hypothetical protein
MPRTPRFISHFLLHLYSPSFPPACIAVLTFLTTSGRLGTYTGPFSSSSLSLSLSLFLLFTHTRSLSLRLKGRKKKKRQRQRQKGKSIPPLRLTESANPTDLARYYSPSFHNPRQACIDRHLRIAGRPPPTLSTLQGKYKEREPAKKDDQKERKAKEKKGKNTETTKTFSRPWTFIFHIHLHKS